MQDSIKIKNENLENFLLVGNKFNRNTKLINLFESKQAYQKLPYETQYALSLINVLDNGTPSKDRTGVGTRRIQSEKITIDLTNGFPAVLGKKVNPIGALVEMVWIMLGRTDVEFLRENGVNYWDSWVKSDGSLGPIYGMQMRNFAGVDQLQNCVDQIKTNPDSRRLMVSLWNPADLPYQALECCHHDYQICSFIDHDGIRKLDLHIKQRSADSFIGIPYDFMLFAHYLEIISLSTELPVNKIHLTMSDYHVYNNHEEAIKKYLNNYFNDPLNKFNFSIDYEVSIDRFVKPSFSWSGEFIAKNMGKDIDIILDSIVAMGFDKVCKISNYTPENHYPFNGAPVAV